MINNTNETNDLGDDLFPDRLFFSLESLSPVFNLEGSFLCLLERRMPYTSGFSSQHYNKNKINNF